MASSTEPVTITVRRGTKAAFDAIAKSQEYPTKPASAMSAVLEKHLKEQYPELYREHVDSEFVPVAKPA